MAVVGMGAAIDDVHQGTGRICAPRAADIAVERQAGLRRRRLGHRQADAEDGIGAQPAFVGRAVERRSSRGRSSLILALRGPESTRRSRRSPPRRPRRRPCRRSASCRRRAARPPRGCRSTRPTARRRGPMAPLSSFTSTSTVGLPRLSRISRAWMSMMAVIGRSPSNSEPGGYRTSAGEVPERAARVAATVHPAPGRIRRAAAVSPMSPPAWHGPVRGDESGGRRDGSAPPRRLH